jgi:Concanavalin A-like lectin/glucanases superfamily
MAVITTQGNVSGISNIGAKPNDYWLNQGLVCAVKPYLPVDLVSGLPCPGATVYPGYLFNTIPGGVFGYTNNNLNVNQDSSHLLLPYADHSINRTYVFRFYRTDNGGSNLSRVMEKRESASFSQVELIYIANTEGRMYYQRTFEGNSEQVYTTEGMALNTLYTVAIRTYPVAFLNSTDFFINGQRVSATGVNFGGGNPIFNTSRYMIGNRGNDFLRNFDGYIFDFMIFNSLLNDQQMIDITSNIDTVYTPDSFVFPIINTYNPFIEGYFNRTAGSLYYGNKLTYLYEGRQYAGLPT